MDPHWTNLALSFEQDAYFMHNPAIAEPGTLLPNDSSRLQETIFSVEKEDFLCLYPGCEWSFPNEELLENHIAIHFNVLPANGPNNGLPPVGGFNPIHTVYDIYDPTVSMAAAPPQILGPVTTLTSNRHPGHAVLAPTPTNNRVGRPRSSCTTCNKTFSRRSDLERHAKKHQPNMRIYHCSVQGCDYDGSYRKDKLEAHVKNCH